ncbi:hypothetical protein [Actinomadura harenae]|uniref:Uncharacterized protein n=1 Tax=Actinomadura harenae TaxID=2483351 RepID=A0A3M2M6Q1_9ACTN|nr:hypothetical protein [Actinomadura harenae]RMI45484.1 hypothetical protein EBO15_09750 [Actinomadura harenae]
MSFGNFARKVRDPGLPLGRRVSALRSCVQLYRPIGFEATLSFLEAEAGPFNTDEDALLRALAVLEASRAAWNVEKQAYAADRRQAKRRGERRPRPGAPNPYVRKHWYGAQREAALHAVRFWHRQRLAALVAEDDRSSRELRECVELCLDAGGHLAPVQRRSLARCVDELTGRLRGGLWHDDRVEYVRVRDLLVVARHIEVATSPPFV